MIFGDPLFLVMAIPGILLGLVLHEYGHARVAYALGDPTPRLQGRLTLDPRVHLDVLGSILILVAGFGWARPVQYNPNKLRNRYWGELAVASAGVGMNVLVAALLQVLAIYLTRAGVGSGETARLILGGLRVAAQINLVLAIFNFLPIPPLDGWRVASRLIPGFARSRVAFYLDQFGMFFLILLLVFPAGKTLLNLLLTPVRWVMGGIFDLLVRLLT